MTSPAQSAPHAGRLTEAALRTRLQDLRVVPVVQIDDAAHAGQLGRALTAGGLPVAEITFRTGAASEAISRLRVEGPDVLVGAGIQREHPRRGARAAGPRPPPDGGAAQSMTSPCRMP